MLLASGEKKMTIKRWKITIEYNGAPYCGWQRQEEGVPSVQHAIEKAIFGFCQQDITIHVAGRTDSGVHAKAQIAHFDLDYGEREITGYELLKAINAHLRPQPISIIGAEIVSNDFSARFDALNKLYRYRIINRPGFLSLDYNLAWHCKKSLDPSLMNDAAQCLLGHHDFSTFRAADCQAKSPEKTLDRLDVSSFSYDDCGGQEIIIEAEARSFLHHQVRNMVGALTLVGEGKWTKEDLESALRAKDRKKGGPTAPAEGLYLVRVDY